VNVGEMVAAGDLVAEIDATVQRNRVEASRASLAALKAQRSARDAALALAQANADRQSRLLREDATTQADFDTAMNTLASAQSSLVELQSQIAQSEATLASEEAQLGYTKIYAPVAGTVASISIKEGQTLNAAQQTPIILRIADLTTMTVEAEVSEADVTKLTPGMEVYFATLGSGDRRWHGTLRQILPTPIEQESTVVFYTALFDVDNRDNALLPGMTTQAFFVTASARNVLKVPVGALELAAAPRRDGGGRTAYVQVQHENGSVERREVRIGVTSRVAAEVLSGLAEGERVIAGVAQQPRAEQERQRSMFRMR
jgi:macrolide-specific efflux system membrane fusion protein